MRAVRGGSSVVCLLPEKKWFWRAAAQLITDIESYCRYLGFYVKTPKSLILGKYRVVVAPTPECSAPLLGH